MLLFLSTEKKVLGEQLFSKHADRVLEYATEAILTRAAGEPFTDHWVEGPSIFRKDGAWIVYFDEYTRHRYGAVRSTDLIHWKRLDITFHQDPRWDDVKGRWDCIYTIARPGGG